MAIGKNDVVEYVMKSPHNTNKAVLETLLDQFGVADNKTEIELSATENKVYTPAEGKVYSKVTVNVPQTELIELTITDTTITEYTAPEGKAYSKVIISVPEAPGE